MKKVKGCIPVLISAVLLSSCVKNNIKMTDEQIDRAAEYAAGVLLKHDKNYENTLSTETIVPESTPKTELKDNNGNLETAKPENDKKSDTDENSQTEQLNTVTLAEVIRVKGCEINFSKFQILDNYEQENSVYIKADTGKKLAVLKFKIKNNSSSDKKVKLLKKNISYILQVDGGGEYQPELSILVNDLQFYNEKIQKGKSKEAVLIFSIPKKEVENTMKLQVTRNKQKAEVKVK